MVRTLRGTLRGTVVVLGVVLLGFFGTLSASAAESPAPSPSASASPVYGCKDVQEYPTKAICVLHVQVAPVCNGDIPELSYAVVAEGSPLQTVTITFKNPGGADIVYADLPLSGTILWPGAVVGPDGKAADWPGWTKQADGSWVAGDEFSWTRPGADLNFEVNPGADASVSYPAASSLCANPPDTEVLADDGVTPASNQVMAATGSNDGPLLFGAIALVVVGVGAVTLAAIARRRKGQNA